MILLYKCKYLVMCKILQFENKLPNTVHASFFLFCFLHHSTPNSRLLNMVLSINKQTQEHYIESPAIILEVLISLMKTIIKVFANDLFYPFLRPCAIEKALWISSQKYTINNNNKWKSSSSSQLVMKKKSFENFTCII